MKELFACFGQANNRVTWSRKKIGLSTTLTEDDGPAEGMPLFDNINSWEQRHPQDYSSGTLNSGSYRSGHDQEDENHPPTPGSYPPPGQGGRQGLTYNNGYVSAPSSIFQNLRSRQFFIFNARDSKPRKSQQSRQWNIYWGHWYESGRCHSSQRGRLGS